jgi:drug/metabolite transporter (DMT)-like permease
MDYFGIGSGLLSAFMASLSFAASAWALRGTKGLTSAGLLANACCVMGVLSVVGIFFVWRPGFEVGFIGRLPALFGTVAAFWCAQCAVFTAQRYVDGSQLVPLLGLKLPMLAILNGLIYREHFSWLQLLAIAMTVAAAFVLNNAGKRIPLKSFCALLVGCLCYSLSDIFLRIEVQQIHEQVTVSQPLASAQCTFLAYLISGVVGACLVPCLKGARVAKALAHSIPYGACWLTSIVFITLCFARLGTVNGSIVQASRGIMSVLMAPVLIMLGMTWLETRTGWWIYLRRLIAAAMMIGAIAFYNLG